MKWIILLLFISISLNGVACGRFVVGQIDADNTRIEILADDEDAYLGHKLQFIRNRKSIYRYIPEPSFSNINFKKSIVTKDNKYFIVIWNLGIAKSWKPEKRSETIIIFELGEDIKLVYKKHSSMPVFYKINDHIIQFNTIGSQNPDNNDEQFILK